MNKTITELAAHRGCDGNIKMETEGKEQKILQVGNLVDSKDGFANPQRGRVYATNGIAPSLDTCGGGNREIKVMIRHKTINF